MALGTEAGDPTHRSRDLAGTGDVGAPHTEVPLSASHRSTRDGGASFEAELFSAPRDEAGEGFEAGSRDEDGRSFRAPSPARPFFRWADRVLGWRDRLLASPRFHRWASRLPGTRGIARRQTRILFDLCAGFVYSQILAAVVELRLLDMLRDGPVSGADLARRMGLPHEPGARLLAAAAALGLIEHRGAGRFGLGMLGAATLGNPGVAAMVAHHRALYADLADPVALLRRGGGGGALSRFWPYAEEDGASDPDVAPYSRLMSVSQPFVAEQVLDAYPVTGYRRLLDIGGGDGTFTCAAARRAPDLAVTVFDLPAVAELAGRRFAAEGLGARAVAVGGSFLDDPLPHGADIVTLVRVVHDHADADALALLRRAHAALAPGGTLLIAEPMAGTRGGDRMGDAYFGFYLLAMGSGRPRRPGELLRLVAEAGFVRARLLPTANPLLASLLVAKASIKVS